MVQMGEDMGKAFTTSAPTAAMLQAAGHAPDRRCNVPLQLGCGVKGGAEIAVGISRATLQMKPAWALFSEDAATPLCRIVNKDALMEYLLPCHAYTKFGELRGHAT